MIEKLYWIAANKFSETTRLSQKGFRVFELMPDYVFLEASEENQEYLSKGQSLGIFWLMSGKKPVEVSEADIQQMIHTSEDSILPGVRIKVINGLWKNLSGVVLQVKDGIVEVHLGGVNRMYVANVRPIDLIVDKDT